MVKLRTEAPVNGGRNYNGPKVSFASLSKIWLFAGNSDVSHATRMQCSRENALGADNQQERPVGNRTYAVRGRARLPAVP